jgi:hypothetical protein
MNELANKFGITYYTYWTLNNIELEVWNDDKIIHTIWSYYTSIKIEK